jgi:hypothetical protein
MAELWLSNSITEVKCSGITLFAFDYCLGHRKSVLKR